ncbi:hypothetical protein JL722_14155 [Aureococcus anophagefferens]|nr:hypothetical protein JL722_14155 [Aureococcus anophagefferens]
MSSKKVDGEGEEKASPEDGAYEEPDEEVEGMKAALTAAQREDLKAELEHEIAQLTIKNIALKEKIGKVEKEMTEGITSREAVIAGESETTKTMNEDAAALDANARLEQDALAAALAARTAAKANAVAESRARTRQDAFEAQHAKKVQSTTATMEANAVRWAGEMESRRLAATTNLQAKIERDVFTQYHTIQNEHSRMKTELGRAPAYQQHRMKLIAAANEHQLRRTRVLEAKIASERKLQDVMSRCIRYHRRVIGRNRGSTVSLPGQDKSDSTSLLTRVTGGGSLAIDNGPDSFAPPEEGDDLSLGERSSTVQSFLGRPARPSGKASTPPIKHRNRNVFLGFAPRDQLHRRPFDSPDDGGGPEALAVYAASPAPRKRHSPPKKRSAAEKRRAAEAAAVERTRKLLATWSADIAAERAYVPDEEFIDSVLQPGGPLSPSSGRRLDWTAFVAGGDSPRATVGERMASYEEPGGDGEAKPSSAAAALFSASLNPRWRRRPRARARDGGASRARPPRARAANSRRIPRLATALRARPALAPESVDFGLSAGAFELTGDESALPGFRRDDAARAGRRAGDGARGRRRPRRRRAPRRAPRGAQARRRRAAPRLAAPDDRYAGADATTAAEARAALDLAGYGARKGAASRRRDDPHHGPGDHEAAFALQGAYRKRLARRGALAAKLARWYRREAARAAYEGHRRDEYLAACHIQSFGVASLRRARAKIASRRYVARKISAAFRLFWLRKVAKRHARERRDARRAAAGADVTLLGSKWRAKLGAKQFRAMKARLQATTMGYHLRRDVAVSKIAKNWRCYAQYIYFPAAHAIQMFCRSTFMLKILWRRRRNAVFLEAFARVVLGKNRLWARYRYEEAWERQRFSAEEVHARREERAALKTLDAHLAGPPAKRPRRRTKVGDETGRASPRAALRDAAAAVFDRALRALKADAPPAPPWERDGAARGDAPLSPRRRRSSRRRRAREAPARRRRPARRRGRGGRGRGGRGRPTADAPRRPRARRPAPAAPPPTTLATPMMSLAPVMAAQPKPRKSRFTVLPGFSGSRPSVWQREADAEAAGSARGRGLRGRARGRGARVGAAQVVGPHERGGGRPGAFRALERDRRRADRAATRAKRAAWKRMTPEERRAEKALIHKLGKVGEQDLTRIKEQAKSRRKDDRRVTREDERRKRRLRKKEKYEARLAAREATHAAEKTRQAREALREARFRDPKGRQPAYAAAPPPKFRRARRDDVVLVEAAVAWLADVAGDADLARPATPTVRRPFRESRRKCWREAVDAAALLKVRKDAADAARDAAVADFRKIVEERGAARERVQVFAEPVLEAVEEVVEAVVQQPTRMTTRRSAPSSAAAAATAADSSAASSGPSSSGAAARRFSMSAVFVRGGTTARSLNASVSMAMRVI